MKPSQVFPTILIVLDVFSAVMYLSEGNWRKAIYWLAAAVLTASVTY